jgi:tRNA(fMet)-specific endonuclease VapC
MSGRFLFDTNIVIALFDSDKEILKNLKKANHILLPSIVVGELFYGAYNSNLQEKNLKKIIDFCTEVQILSCDYLTATLYGSIKKELKEIGKPIPENDIWISAISIQNNIPLVSRDKHLTYIQNLKLINW